MKNLFINLLFFGIVGGVLAITIWLSIFLSELQFQNMKDFEGLTHEQIVEGVEYTKKHSYYPENY